MSISPCQRWQNLETEAMAAIAGGRAREAISSLEAALPLAEGFGTGDLRLPQTLLLLGMAWSDAGRITTGIAHLERALALTDQHPEAVTDFTFRIVSLLAAFYFQIGRPADAERLAARAVSLTRAVHGPASAEAAIVQCYLASLLLGRGNLDLAEQLYSQSVLTLRDHGAEDPQALLVCLDDLSRICMIQGRFSAALPLMLERIDRLRELPRPTRKDRKALREAERLAEALRSFSSEEGAAGPWEASVR